MRQRGEGDISHAVRLLDVNDDFSHLPKEGKGDRRPDQINDNGVFLLIVDWDVFFFFF